LKTQQNNAHVSKEGGHPRVFEHTSISIPRDHCGEAWSRGRCRSILMLGHPKTDAASIYCIKVLNGSIPDNYGALATTHQMQSAWKRPASNNYHILKPAYHPIWRLTEASVVSSERNSISEVQAGPERETSW